MGCTTKTYPSLTYSPSLTQQRPPSSSIPDTGLYQQESETQVCVQRWPHFDKIHPAVEQCLLWPQRGGVSDKQCAEGVAGIYLQSCWEQRLLITAFTHITSSDGASGGRKKKEKKKKSAGWRWKKIKNNKRRRRRRRKAAKVNHGIFMIKESTDVFNVITNKIKKNQRGVVFTEDCISRH